MNADSMSLGQIAVVDDTAANLHLLCNLLENAGYDVRPFPRGAIALEGISYSPPDLILLDIQMPEMNGYDICEKLKSNESTENIPVIFISAFNETFDKVKAFQVGGVDYITKPFQAEEVLVRVATHLELYQIKKQLQTTNSVQAEQLVVQNAQLLHLNQSLQQANQQLQRNYEKLKQTQLQLIQTEKMATLGDLVAGVAHEINNPIGFVEGNLRAAFEYLQDLLTILSLYAENTSPPESIISEISVLDPKFIAEDFRQLMVSMKKGCERIRKISISLRIFSRKDTASKTEFNLHEGIDSTLLILKYRLKANKDRPAIEVVKNYGKIPPVKCYAGQINQVFMNLLANAIDALDESNEGKVFEEIEKRPNCITISTELSSSDNSIIVRISDNGVGMPKEVKAKIFEQGFTTKGVGKGTGLGMAIAHQIVTEKHGGQITCNSLVGQGTIFTIMIPR
ncbi:response regulator [Okeania sp. SIO2C9]|uniref:hybrid sensor histidine kinase/response regulator n=1 Tax=Okeania sp. SIO2C9 TaxID=2607791 RepID=UPI0025D6B2CC|nr:response regulator [Okeania sp. SIO2C9]